MPHINRLRVNNVKYNFGTQFYDDFVMKPFCSNTLYDLANGGGKSVLMLLLLQNIIPNCTLDDKQPIEKLFRTGNGSTVIHSLIEWKLNENDIKSGYTYMTTGFCARKASPDSAEEKAKDTESIEYFNYCIFYREYNDNDIRNLPLVKNGERITYTGLKKYLKELERDSSLIVKIFDRKGEYQRFISNYGIYESEWEIIRGINKTEGHVRTYFETNYKTTRKVVEDLLIEQIIQKSFQIKTNQSDDGEAMAETLLNIKDKLIELSKKKSELINYDRQIEILSSFSERIKSISSIYKKKEDLQKSFIKAYNTGKSIYLKKSTELENLNEKNKCLLFNIKETGRKVDTAKVQRDKDEAVMLAEEIEAVENEIRFYENKQEEKQYNQNIREAVNHYLEYIEEKNNRDEILEAIKNIKENNQDLINELKTLAYNKKLLNAEKNKKFLNELNELKTELEELNKEKIIKEQEERKLDKAIAVDESSKIHLYGEKEKHEGKISALRKNVNLLFIENVENAIKENQDILCFLEKSLVEFKEKKTIIAGELENIRIRMAENKLMSESVIKAVEENERNMLEYKTNKAKLEKLNEIYDVNDIKALLKKIHAKYKESISEAERCKQEIEERTRYLNDISMENPVLKNQKIVKLKEYLEKKFRGEFISGLEYMSKIDASEKEALLQRIPFICDAIVVKDFYDEVILDLENSDKNFGEGTVSIINKKMLKSEKTIIDKESCFFYYGNKTLFLDDKKIDKEKQRINCEIEEFKETILRFKDQESVYETDYEFLKEFLKYSKEMGENLKNEGKNRKEERQSLEAEYMELEKSLEALESDKILNENLIRESSKKIENTKFEIENLEQISEAEKKLKNIEENLKRLSDKLESQKTAHKKVIERIKEIEEKIDEKEGKISYIDKELQSINNLWNMDYSMYYEEGEYKTINIDESEIDSKFKGKKTVFEREHGDIKDKERLVDSYINAMNKSLREISKRHVSIAFLEKLRKEKGLYSIEDSKLKEYNNEIEQLKESNKNSKKHLESIRTKKDRLTGQISQAKLNIEEKYGYFKEIDNIRGDIASFIDENIKALKVLEKEAEGILKTIKTISEEITFYEEMNKDINRIIESEKIQLRVTDEVLKENIDISEYFKEILLEYEQLRKDEHKRKEEFVRQKEKTAETLELLGAYELSREVKNSVSTPQKCEEAENLMTGIEETNSCIELEKERILRGIEDMERIKDNFENQCLQRCRSIKTELERFAKLSKINLDGQNISIINLSIPYVKEDMIKSRMSQYIDDVVVRVDEFAGSSERLRYIKNSLSWKKLFSVIVTDMNSIKLTLYKRERIKEQSRHLKYEEAVGSTGQSQGIYIQFLISVINYITNINSANGNNTGLRKVIFIDNPFGAAKDVYIWEPIFELLYTNNVQLIVPARGTTPAITGRFDVNYILGQKIIDGKQQTVVVEYRSQVDTKETEYSPLQYEQTSLSI